MSTGICCQAPRPEFYELEAPRNGMARIDRCLECGAHKRTWVRRPDDPPKAREVVTPLQPWERLPWPEYLR